MKADNSKHVVMCDSGEMECLHCGERFPVAYPIDVTVMCTVMDRFVSRHRGCLPHTESE